MRAISPAMAVPALASSTPRGPAPKRQTTTLCGTGGCHQTTFIFGRREVAKRRVQALPVVEDLHELEDRPPRLCPGRPRVAVHELGLQRGVERLDHGVVPDLPGAGQALPDPVGRQQLPEPGGGVLAAPDALIFVKSGLGP